METMYLSYFTKSTDFPFFIQYGEHKDDLFLHTHADFSELTIVLSGTAVHIVDDERFIVKKGDVFVISDEIAHGYEEPRDFKICNIMYREEDLLWSESDIRKSPGFHGLFVIEPSLAKEQKFQSRLALSITEFEAVNQMIANMIYEYGTRTPGWRTELKGLCMQLVVFLSRAYRIAPENKENRLNLALALSYMENQFQQPISIEELADKANLSVRHFSRLFQSTYHTSPVNYITQIRVQYACMLLKNLSLSITQVAKESGFSDSNYFARRFKKVIGVTPGEYRRKIVIDKEGVY